MAEKDIIGKHIIKQIAVDIAIYLLHLDINPNEVELLTTEQQRVEERRADLVVKLSYRNQQTFILHVEIQNDNHKNMPLRMLRYYTDIALSHPKLTVMQYVIYIGKQPLKMANTQQNDDWIYHYHLIDMHSIDSSIFIAQDNPDALVLALLCDFKGKDSQEMVNHITSRLYALLKGDEKKFRDYLIMLNVLSENRDLQQVKKAAEMLTQVSIEKMPYYQLGLEQGIEQGVEQGIEQGKLAEKLAMARTMLEEGFDSDIIVKITGISKVELLQLNH